MTAPAPSLNSVREVNPDALAIAATASTAQKPARSAPARRHPDPRQGQHRDRPTASTRPPVRWPSQRRGPSSDATVGRRLRAAGAVILGKANLTEFANILAIDMPAGYSSLGGQVKNPYAPALDDKGVPIVPPGGSSSGSAVAVAAGLCAAAIGTETSGSLLSPATQNGLVTVKPTVGPHQPRRHRPDRAQPGYRRSADPHRARRGDPAQCARGPRPARSGDPALAAPGGLHRGPRQGRAEGRADRRAERPRRPGERCLLRQAVAAARRGDGRGGCDVGGSWRRRSSAPTSRPTGWIGGPGTEMAVLNRNPESRTKHEPARTARSCSSTS